MAQSAAQPAPGEEELEEEEELLPVRKQAAHDKVVDMMGKKEWDYLNGLTNTFGAELTASMLPQLVRLLPAKDKRVALYVAAGLCRA